MFVVFCCGLALVSFTRLLQGYLNGTGAIVIVPQISDATLNNRGKFFAWIHQELLPQPNQIKAKEDHQCICLCNTVYTIYTASLQKFLCAI